MNCPECGFKLNEGTNFCGQCGAKLMSPDLVPSSTEKNFTKEQTLIRQYLPAHLFEKIRSSSQKVAGERRQLTAMFADLMGYTSMSETIGEEEVEILSIQVV
jgi:hypothetical protein